MRKNSLAVELHSLEEDKEVQKSESNIPHVNKEEPTKPTDFILVYTSDVEENKTRKTYEKNLEKRGLELKTFTCSTDEDIIFVTVHAPLEKVLYQKAEDMNIQMPIKILKKNNRRSEIDSEEDKKDKKRNFFQNLLETYGHLDPFALKQPFIRRQNQMTTATFSKANVDLFEPKNDHNPYFFESAERSRMVRRILQLTSFKREETDEEVEEHEDDTTLEKGHGIEQLCHKGIYDSYYPLHDGPLVSRDSHEVNDRIKLRHNWASFSKTFKYQPLDAIRDYFGVRVSFYFAWLGAYTTFLVPAAIVGSLCFLYALVTMTSSEPLTEICDEANERLFYMCPQCDRHCSFYSLTANCHYSRFAHFFDNEATVFFSVFMSVWATLFLEYWKRTQATLAFRWNVYDLLKEYEPLRPEFVVKVEDKEKNPVTGKREPYIPKFIRVRRTLGAFGVVCVMASVVIGTLIGIVVYRASVLAALYAHSIHDLRENAKLVTSFTAATINLIFIKILTWIYFKIAVFLTNWENPRTVSEYHNSFTLKMYVFEFVNTYSSLFYVAFFQSSLMNGTPVKYNRVSGRRIEECHPAGCLIDVCIQLAVIMTGKQIWGLVTEFVFPSFSKWWFDADDASPQWEKDYCLGQEPEFRMFYEYLDMVIQFGFVTMFVASFPLAPLFALVNNFIEIRADAINFVVNYRRRVAEQVKNIGIWFQILEIVTKISVIVNSFVIAFTTDFIPRFKEYLEPSKPYDFSKQFLYVMLCRFIFVIVFQYFVFLVKGTISYLVPDIPSSVQAMIARKMHVARMCFRKSAAETMHESTQESTQPRSPGPVQYDSGVLHVGNKKSSKSNSGKARNINRQPKMCFRRPSPQSYV